MPKNFSDHKSPKRSKNMVEKNETELDFSADMDMSIDSKVGSHLFIRPQTVDIDIEPLDVSSGKTVQSSTSPATSGSLMSGKATGPSSTTPATSGSLVTGKTAPPSTSPITSGSLMPPNSSDPTSLKFQKISNIPTIEFESMLNTEKTSTYVLHVPKSKPQSKPPSRHPSKPQSKPPQLDRLKASDQLKTILIRSLRLAPEDRGFHKKKTKSTGSVDRNKFPSLDRKKSDQAISAYDFKTRNSTATRRSRLSIHEKLLLSKVASGPITTTTTAPIVRKSTSRGPPNVPEAKSKLKPKATFLSKPQSKSSGKSRSPPQSPPGDSSYQSRAESKQSEVTSVDDSSTEILNNLERRDPVSANPPGPTKGKPKSGATFKK